MKKENKYYVYVYLDPRKPGKYVYGKFKFDYEPFYVGKGFGKRYKGHLKEAYGNKDNNSYKSNVIRKIRKELDKEPIIIKYKENMSEKISLKLEIDMIKTIKRKKFKGPLTNQTDGGEGTSGYKFSKEHNYKQSIRMAGEGNNMFGKKHTKNSIEQNISNQKTRRLVKIFNKTYVSIRTASRETKIPRTSLVRKLKSDDTDFVYVKGDT